MRILQVIPHLSKGGAERVVVELSNSLKERGHEVTVLVAYPVDVALNQRYLNENIAVQFVSDSGKNRIWRYLQLPFWILRHWRTLRDYDVIHCHLTFGLIFGSIISLLRKSSRKVEPRLIATCHMIGVGGGLKVMNEQLSRYFDVFVLMAEDVAWRAFADNHPKRKIVIVPNGISGKTLLTNQKSRETNAPWKIGTISRLEVERRPWLFLEVFAEILRLSPNEDFDFVIGGEGPEREALTALAEKLGLTASLSMSGLILEPQTFLSDLDLYISMNVEGITGIAGLEAVFAGLPVVAIQLSSEYSRKPSDWIWSDQKPIEVAQKIISLKNDRAMLMKLAQGQLQFASTEYSTEHMTDEYLKVYEK